MAAITRLMQYGEIFDGTIKEEIGQGSGGTTVVYRLVSNDGLETALKVVPVFNMPGKKSRYPGYKESRDALCDKAILEVKIVYELEAAPHIMPYKRYCVKDWDEDSSFGCDLLIQMPLLENIYKLVIDKGPLSEDQIIILGKNLCTALNSCHKISLIHRDIKPHNIFRNKLGDYVLGDFGIARIKSPEDDVSRVAYTPPFAAPEQVNHRQANPLTDIYSLGLTMYYLGNYNRLPFLSSTFTLDTADATRRRIAGAPLPPPESCGKALSKIILKACAPRPENRFQSAEEFLYALETLSASPKGRTEARPLSPEKHHREPEAPDPYATAVASPGPIEGTMPRSADDPERYETEYAKPGGRPAAEEGSNLAGDMYQTDMARPGDQFLPVPRRGTGGRKPDMPRHAPDSKPDYSVLDTAQLAQLASEGDPIAQYRFGEVCFFGGKGMSPNPAKAVGWLSKAAEQGDISAQLFLSECYYNGTGVQEDHFEAVRWARKAAEQGDSTACWTLGVCYFRDDGVPASGDNKNEAVRWFRMAAEQGHAKAQSWLADCYYHGDGVLKDTHQALVWYERAADLGDPDGQFGLAVCYLTGDGVRKSPFEAIKLLRDAASQNHLGAEYYLGECYYAGFNGITIDHAEAFSWFNKAAMHGAPDAQCRLGDCFLYGIGTGKSESKAIIWYKAAAKGGSPEAEEKLRELHVPM